MPLIIRVINSNNNRAPNCNRMQQIFLNSTFGEVRNSQKNNVFYLCLFPFFSLLDDYYGQLGVGSERLTHM